MQGAAKYRKRPVVIEAVQFRPGEMRPDGRYEGLNDDEINRFVGGARLMWSSDGCPCISTLEGVMRAEPGDWIIRGVKGEFYPCKPDIFDASYESC